MNEMYAKDISKKIRSTFKSKGNSGKHTFVNHMVESRTTTASLNL